MITKLFERRATKHGVISPKDPALARWLGLGYGTSSKVDVNEETAMRFTAFFAAVRIITDSIASLPLHVYERKAGGGRTEVTMHPASYVLNVEPNNEMGAMTLRETQLAGALGFGNGFAEIRRDGRQNVMSLHIRQPEHVTLERSRQNNGLLYNVQSPGGESRLVESDKMLHIKGLGGDGLIGYSPVRMFAEAIGMGLAAEKFGATFYGNSARPSGGLSLPNTLSDGAYKRMQEDLDEKSKPHNAHRPLLLEGGATWQAFTMPLNEAQFIEARKFQLQEIARIFRIPLHMLGDLDRATFSNISEQSLDFGKHTIRPWCVRLEQEYNRMLLRDDERKKLFIKHNMEGVLRADIKTRYLAYKSARNDGWMNVDEIREKEDMNPLPDGQGQIYLVPKNMQPADQAGKEDGKPGEGVPAPNTPNETGESDDRSEFLSHLLTETVSGLVSREVRNAQQQARRNPKEFHDWLDRFYEKQSELMVKRLGERHAALIEEHIRESRELLLETEGRAHLETFRGLISVCVDDWEISRVDSLVDKILGA